MTEGSVTFLKACFGYLYMLRNNSLLTFDFYFIFYIVQLQFLTIWTKSSQFYRNCRYLLGTCTSGLFMSSYNILKTLCMNDSWIKTGNA